MVDHSRIWQRDYKFGHPILWAAGTNLIVANQVWLPQARLGHPLTKFGWGCWPKAIGPGRRRPHLALHLKENYYSGRIWPLLAMFDRYEQDLIGLERPSPGWHRPDPAIAIIFFLRRNLIWLPSAKSGRWGMDSAVSQPNLTGDNHVQPTALGPGWRRPDLVAAVIFLFKGVVGLGWQWSDLAAILFFFLRCTQI